MHESEVKRFDGRVGIYHVYDHVGVFDMVHGCYLGLFEVLLVRVKVRGIQTSCVDKFDLTRLILKLINNRISRCISSFRDNHTGLPQKLINKRRFPDIRATDNRDLDWFFEHRVLVTNTT